MLLQVILFPFALIFFGGILTLLAVVDPHHKRSAPRVGFPMFYAGVFSLVLSWGLAGLAILVSWHWAEEEFVAVAFLAGYLVGMAGGGVLGYQLALKHKRHLIESSIVADDAKVIHDC